MSTPATFANTDTCAICLRLFPAGSLNECSCGECHCDDCPAFGCACEYPDEPEFQAINLRLRAAAIELAALRTKAGLLGHYALTDEQQARLRLLVDVVTSLRAEVNRLDEERYGEVYPEDETSDGASLPS